MPHYRRKFRNRLLTGVFVLAAIAFLLIYLFETKFSAIVRDTAEMAVKAKAVYILNQAIFEETAREKITYDSLVSFEKDNTGQITALKTNATEINRLKSSL